MCRNRVGPNAACVQDEGRKAWRRVAVAARSTERRDGRNIRSGLQVRRGTTKVRIKCSRVIAAPGAVAIVLARRSTSARVGASAKKTRPAGPYVKTKVLIPVRIRAARGSGPQLPPAAMFRKAKEVIGPSSEAKGILKTRAFKDFCRRKQLSNDPRNGADVASPGRQNIVGAKT